jgi:hypothetical protein
MLPSHSASVAWSRSPSAAASIASPRAISALRSACVLSTKAADRGAMRSSKR